MSYLVFARKYRPQTFEQVIQQNHVTQTLTNAIAAQRVAHAILFSGPRGTGKTTVARILAKAMNCSEGPTAQPCNQCRSCLEITAGNSADVFEIDGASNNGVDQVRELRENLKYMPVYSRYKIYIIDEVHMLSLPAFNALLKSLEEPPEHIMFMFATTEVHKIPITILSRCQRHDLRRIEGTAIAKHLRHICEEEEIEADDESLALIAQEAGGSMRDSLSLLDHVIACAQGAITLDLISDLLGIVDRKHFFDISQAVFSRDIQKVLEGIDAVWRNGYELKRFYADLVAHFHHLVAVKLTPQADRLLDLSQQEITRLKAEVEDIPDSYLLQVFDHLFQAEPTIKLSSQPRLALEMVFFKFFQTAPSLPIDDLIDHLDQLKSKIGSGQGMPDIHLMAPPIVENSESAIKESPVAPNKEDVVPKEKSLDHQEAVLDMKAIWDKVIQTISDKKPSLAGFLSKCTLNTKEDGVFELQINGNEFTYKNVVKHQQAIKDQCEALLGKPVHIELVANFKDSAAKKEEKKKNSHLKQKAINHPLVMEAIELFDGRVIDIKLP